MPAEEQHPPSFSIVVEPGGDEVVLAVSGELDLSTAGALEREVGELRSAGFRRFVVDLRSVTFVDSTGLRILLVLQRRAEGDGHALTLVDGSPAVARIVELTATREAFDWRDG